MNNRYLILIVLMFLIFSACVDKLEPYSLSREQNINTMITKEGAVLQTDATDSLVKLYFYANEFDQYASIKSTLKSIDLEKADTIISYGFCWQTLECGVEPLLTDSNFVQENEQVVLSKNLLEFTFSGKISYLKRATNYKFRSFVIRSNNGKIDTGYHPIETNFLSLTPHDVWIEDSAVMPIKRTDGVAVKCPKSGGSTSEVIYIGTGASGLGLNAPLLNDFLMYDPETAAWSQCASLPTARRGAIAFHAQKEGGYDYLYLGYGVSSNLQQPSASDYIVDFFEFNPRSNSWTPRSAHLSVGKRDMFAFGIGQKGYVGGGEYLGGYSNTVAAYNATTGNWEPAGIPNLTNSVAEAVAFEYNGKGYVFGGRGQGNVYYNSLFEFDPKNSSWVFYDDVPTSEINIQGLANGIGFGIDYEIDTDNDGQLESYSYIFCGGGRDENGVLHDEFWGYNISSGRWEKRSSIMDSPREGALYSSAVYYQAETEKFVERGFAGGGFYNDTVRRDFWEYLP